MTDRVRSLRRFAVLRMAQQRLREAEFGRIAGKVHMLEEGLRSLDNARWQTHEEANKAFTANGWQTWWIGEASDASAGRRAEMLEEERAAALVERERTGELLKNARQKAEQTNLLLEQARNALREAEDRRLQRESDDRFALRAHWLAQ